VTTLPDIGQRSRGHLREVVGSLKRTAHLRSGTTQRHNQMAQRSTRRVIPHTAHATQQSYVPRRAVCRRKLNTGSGSHLVMAAVPPQDDHAGRRRRAAHTWSKRPPGG